MSLKHIIEQFDWRSYIEEHYEYKPVRDREMRICCPNCADEKFKCYVNPEKGVFNCFKCAFRTGLQYDVVDFVALTERMTRGAAYMMLTAEYSPITPEDIFAELDVLFAENKLMELKNSLRTIEMPSTFHKLTSPEDPLQVPYWEYLWERGLTVEEVASANVHFCPFPMEELYKRVIWPIYGGDGQLISYIARTIDPAYKGKSKYKNCPDSDISKTFWPYVKPKSKSVVLVEGILDCYAIRRVYPTCYATFGKAMSDSQKALLEDWGVETVTLFWDKKDAQKEMETEVEKLKLRFRNVKVPNWAGFPADKDAGDGLKNPEILDSLKTAIDTSIDVNTFEYFTWQLDHM